MTRFGFLLVFLSGCFAPLDNPDTSGSCASHQSAASCAADSACEAKSCPACDGGVGFAGCVERGHGSAACPEIKCAAPCSSYTDEASCQTAGCFAATCPACDNQTTFIGCYDGANPPPFQCELPECPVDCTGYMSDAACSADPSCYALFEQNDACDCAGSGCCMQFAGCENGPPVCNDMPDCSLAPIECGPDYTPVVLDGCVAGCTRAASCPLGV